jgi:hypothetical protein
MNANTTGNFDSVISPFNTTTLKSAKVAVLFEPGNVY